MSDSNKVDANSDLRTSRKRPALGLVAFAVLCILGVVALYHYIVTGGLRARQTPSALETALAQGLVNFSIPNQEKSRRNPLNESATGPDTAAGQGLYQKHCEVCHGFDGGGKTVASGGLYPPPLDLRHVALVRRKRTDGELFYFIRNGVRNTGMPGWQLTEQQIWQLVAYIRALPETVTADATAPTDEHGFTTRTAHYVGSAACRKCHASIYETWRTTPMANIVRNPREHPDAIIPDLSTKDPLVSFTAADIAFVYGSKWKQRYFKKIGDDYYVLPAQWDVTHHQWRPYFVKEDWWAPLYPPDNFRRPTSALCDGCHSVNYDIKTKTVTEWNVGCEKCHGPGSDHVQHPTSSNIVNPARQGYVPANDVCIQCHSQGRALENPIAGKYYDWPVGYDVTRKLSDFWKLEDHKLGDTSFTHFGDGTAHKNRMQGNDFVTSLMYTHGVTCFTCHDVHGTGNSANLRKSARVLCLDCHGPNSPNGPHAATIEQHTHHKADSAGSECIACHMPKIAQTIADVNVRSHTFRFVYPAMTEALHIPNACNNCHSDKTTMWATAALKTWADRSPWRIGQ
ncbi:MAG TPA: c-type cytochrome [Verrucomicrobiae bacterium]|nr:c-type cytochrome [Verrucomicrobiae bacterium]